MTTPNPQQSTTQPLFLDLNGRRLFALQILPTGPCTGAVLCLPAYAEEMNRCRSHVAEQARALAATGLRCLLLDPYGTGESEGLSTDADWAIWRDDAVAAVQWLAAQSGQPVALWGTRTGALLAADVATCGQVAVSRLLFWQPVLDGKQFLNQYLRLRIASQMVHGTSRETTATVLQRLAAGEDIEVAGYPLSGRLAGGITTRRMGDMPGLSQQRISWIDVVTQADQPLPPASQRLVDTLVGAGGQVAAVAVAGPMFWQLAGNHAAPELQRATLRMMGEGL